MVLIEMNRICSPWATNGFKGVFPFPPALGRSPRPAGRTSAAGCILHALVPWARRGRRHQMENVGENMTTEREQTRCLLFLWGDPNNFMTCIVLLNVS